MKQTFILAALIMALVLGPIQAFATYGSDTAITVTLTSLASASRQQSVCVDNTTNVYTDAFVMLKSVKTGASGTAATGYVEVFAGGSQDGGTTWTENATASGSCTTDTTITLTVPPNIKLIGICNAVANATTYTCGPYMLSTAFGSTIPQKWFLVIGNQTGHALDTSAGGTVTYQGVK